MNVLYAKNYHVAEAATQSSQFDVWDRPLMCQHMCH